MRRRLLYSDVPIAVPPTDAAGPENRPGACPPASVQSILGKTFRRIVFHFIVSDDALKVPEALKPLSIDLRQLAFCGHDT